MSAEIDIKFVREKLGWTQQQMADQLGIDRSTVAHAENGRALRGPTAILLRRIADENRVPPEGDMNSFVSEVAQ